MKIVRQIEFDYPSLGSKVKELRIASGKTPQVLATDAGISQAYWYQIEKGDRKYITEEILRGIEKALGCDLGVVFDN